jgi:uncharacterized membrane protein
MKLIPYLIGWSVLVLVVITLALYRRMVTEKEDDIIHLSDTSGAVASQQVQMARRLESIDRWGKILTILSILTGLALAGWYGYIKWIETTTY